MALVVKDRVRVSTTTTGTGTITLGAAVLGFQDFSVIGNGNTTYYAIVDSVTGAWEVGLGTYSSTGPTLSRDTILESSTGGTAVSFVAGSKDVFVTYPAEKAVMLDAGSALVPAVASLEILTNTTPAILTKDDNLTSWVYSNKSFNVVAEETAPTGLFFSPDGTRMYVIGTAGDDVNQYALSTAWDVTTASFVRVSAVVGDTAPQGLFFRADGLKMYTIGSTNDSVREFNLSTAWDVSTIAFVQEFLIGAQDTVPLDLWFKPDGLKMYIVGSANDRVNEYNLSTAWNVSTATFLQFFSVAAQELTPVAVNFNVDGTKMYVLGSTGVDINRYTLSTAWDVSTAVFFNNFYIGFQETAPTGLFVNTVADVAYVVGTTSDTVFQYTTLTDGIELISNSGLFVSGSLYTNNNLVVTSGTRLDGTLSVSGGTSLGTTGVGGTLTASGAVNMSTTTGLITLGTAQTTGTFTVGGPAQTGAITVGQSTGAQTLNLATGATATATTKAVNIGTAGLSGSTTNINIGSAVAGALGDIFLNQPTDIVVNSTTDALRITQTGTGNALLVEDSANPDATPFAVDATGDVLIGSSTTIPGAFSDTGKLQIAQNTGEAGIQNFAFTNATGGAIQYFNKSRSATIGTNTIVQSGDTIGNITFAGADGTSYTRAASITADVDGTPGTNDMPGRLVFSTTADGASTPTERMRIDNAGQIIQGTPTGAVNGALQLRRNITGGTTAYTAGISTTVQSDVTGQASGFSSFVNTAAASFTLSLLKHFNAQQGTIGATSAVTNQYGFFADSSLVGATNDYGFYGDIASGTGRWNFYANGTADNYFAGRVGVGLAASAGIKTRIANDRAVDAFALSIDTYNGASFENSLIAGFNGTNAFLGNFQNFSLNFITNNVTRQVIAANGTISLGAAPGAESLRVTPVASAVNYLNAYGAATGNQVNMRAEGSDTNIGINMTTKGSGSYDFYTSNYGGTQFRIINTASAVNYLQVTGDSSEFPKLSAQGSSANVAMVYVTKGTQAHIFQTNGGTNQFLITNTASAVNYLQVTGAATGNAAVLSAQGSDTNISIALTPKGTGNVGVGTASPGEKLDVVGSVRGTQIIASNGLIVNNMTIAANYTIPAGYSASSVGPVIVNSGVAVTVPSGSRWVVQ